MIESYKQAYAWPDTHRNLNTHKLTQMFLIEEEANTYQVLGHILAHQ